MRMKLLINDMTISTSQEDCVVRMRLLITDMTVSTFSGGLCRKNEICDSSSLQRR